MVDALVVQREVRSCLHLQKLLKLSIHDLNCLMRPVNYSLEQLSRLYDRYLSLLLFRWSQSLESSVEIVFYFLVYLRHDVLFFLSDDINELEALLSLERVRLQILLQAQLGLIPLVLTPSHVTLDHFIVTRLLLPSLLHLLLRFTQSPLVNLELILQILDLFDPHL